MTTTSEVRTHSAFPWLSTKLGEESFPPPPADVNTAAAERTADGIACRLREPERATRPLIVCIHGIGDSSITFEPLVGTFLAKGHRVLTFDFLGRGFSHEGTPADYSLAGHLAQVQRVLQHHDLVHTPKVLVAHSMGGIVATAHAAQDASCRSVVMISPAGALKKNPVGGLAFTLNYVCRGLRDIALVPLIAKVVNGDPPPEDLQCASETKAQRAALAQRRAADVMEDFGPGGEAAWISRGEERLAWCLGWHRAFQKTAYRQKRGNRHLVGAALRMPFSSVGAEVRKLTEKKSDAVRNDVKVLVLAAANDPTCAAGNIDFDVYRSLFGSENVTVRDDFRGMHAFHVQDAELVGPVITQFFED